MERFRQRRRQFGRLRYNVTAVPPIARFQRRWRYRRMRAQEQDRRHHEILAARRAELESSAILEATMRRERAKRDPFPGDSALHPIIVDDTDSTVDLREGPAEVEEEDPYEMFLRMGQ